MAVKLLVVHGAASIGLEARAPALDGAFGRAALPSRPKNSRLIRLLLTDLVSQPTFSRSRGGEANSSAANCRRGVCGAAARRIDSGRSALAGREWSDPLNRAKPNAAPRLTPRALTAVAAFLVLAGAALWILMTPSRSGTALIGGPFQLQTTGGKTLTDADLKGHPFLVYFGYTHCPDVCPTTLAQISDVLGKMPDKPIRALFVTVDPERDTPAMMADYVSSFDPRIVGLSGTPQEIAQVEKAYRVYARKAPTKDGDYSMDHSSIVYLMDARGGFVEAFNLDRTPEASAKELQGYL
jgi:protein SCO1/2